MPPCFFFTLCAATAALAASIVIARPGTPLQRKACKCDCGNTSLMFDTPTTHPADRNLLPSMLFCKDGMCEVVPKNCEEERDAFAKQISAKKSEIRVLQQQCKKDILSKRSRKAYLENELDSLNNRIEDKQDQRELVSQYKLQYGLWMCDRLKRGFVMKPPEPEAVEEFGNVCNGTLDLEEAAAHGQGPGDSHGPGDSNVMPSRSPLISRFLSRDRDHPELTPECKKWAGPVHEELVAKIREYDVIKGQCKAAGASLQKDLDELEKEKNDLHTKDSSISTRETAIRTCVATYVAREFCNYKSVQKRPTCDCPCLPDPARVYWEKTCPPTDETLPIPLNCVRLAQ